MKRTQFAVIAAALLVSCVAAQAGWMELVGTPTQVIENGQAGWEYWYDVYCDIAAPTQLWLEGFDGTETLNLNGGTLYQRWDSASAGYTIFGQLGDYPSYRPDKTGPDVWTLNTTDWAMDNPIHTPSEYSGVNNNSMYAGSSSEDGIHFWQAIGNGYRSGLFMTIRLVHPLAPGEITYSMYGAFYWEQQNAAIVGPAVSGPQGDFNGDGDIDADDIDILCANMGGDPLTYDIDGDGDVDEDDLIEFVEVVVEYDTDGDGTPDGTGTYRGDFNLDGVVNATDLQIQKGFFGGSGIGYAAGNANCDTVVNATDLQIMKATFGSAAAAVPEPLTVGLTAIGGLALLRRRR